MVALIRDTLYISFSISILDIESCSYMSLLSQINHLHGSLKSTFSSPNFALHNGYNSLISHQTYKFSLATSPKWYSYSPYFSQQNLNLPNLSLLYENSWEFWFYRLLPLYPNYLNNRKINTMNGKNVITTSTTLFLVTFARIACIHH